MSFTVTPGVETVEIDESVVVPSGTPVGDTEGVLLRPTEVRTTSVPDYITRLTLEKLKKQWEAEQVRLEIERKERQRLEEEKRKIEEEKQKGGIGDWDPILISLVRRAMPNLIAYDVCGVQPMVGPTGLIFAMRSKYQSKDEPIFEDYKQRKELPNKGTDIKILESKPSPLKKIDFSTLNKKITKDELSALKKKWSKGFGCF
jgi:Major capsid protein Gp23